MSYRFYINSRESENIQLKMYIRTIYFWFLIIGVFSRELPKYLTNKRCSLKDFHACFIKNGNLAIPLVAKGDPDFHIPNMMPMEVSFIQLISTPTLALNMTNVHIHGLDKTIIMDNELNFDQTVFTIMFKNDNITVEGVYTADGKVMVMPIKGDGHFNVLLKNGMYNLTYSAKMVELDGEKYIKPLNQKLTYHFDKVEFQFDNLFDGNKELGNQVNQFLNENWKPLLVDFGPGIASTVSNILMDIIEKFLSKVSFGNFFTDYED